MVIGYIWSLIVFFLFTDTPTTEIYTSCHTLSLPYSLPICRRAPLRSDTAARRPRRVGGRPRYDFPSAPYRQPFDVPRGRGNVRCGDESVPPHEIGRAHV